MIEMLCLFTANDLNMWITPFRVASAIRYGAAANFAAQYNICGKKATAHDGAAAFETGFLGNHYKGFAGYA
jgi:hypothetical protein